MDLFLFKTFINGTTHGIILIFKIFIKMNGMFSIAYRYELKLAMYFSYKNWNDVIGNGEVKWSLFADDMRVNKENPRDVIRKTRAINECGKVAGNKMNTQKYLYFYTPKMNDEREIKETIPFAITSKRIRYLEINLPKKAKTCTQKTIRNWWNKLKTTLRDGKKNQYCQND